MTESIPPVVRNFTDLLYWQKAHRLYMAALEDVKSIPTGERGTRELADQLLRCVASIAANIAEGYASDSTAEYCRYLTIARKSCSEAMNWYLQGGAAGYIQGTESRVESCQEISRMIYAARNTLQARLQGEQKGTGTKSLQQQVRFERR